LRRPASSQAFGYGRRRYWGLVPVISATLSFSIMARRAQFGGAMRKVFEELKIQVSTKPVSFGLRSRRAHRAYEAHPS